MSWGREPRNRSGWKRLWSLWGPATTKATIIHVPKCHIAPLTDSTPALSSPFQHLTTFSIKKYPNLRPEHPAAVGGGLAPRGGLFPPRFWGSLRGVTPFVFQDSDGDKSDDLVVDVSNEVRPGRVWGLGK